MAPDPSLPDDWQQQVGRAYLAFGVSRVKDTKQYAEFINIGAMLRGAREHWTPDLRRRKAAGQRRNEEGEWVEERGVDLDLPGIRPEARAHVAPRDEVDEIDLPDEREEQKQTYLDRVREELVPMDTGEMVPRKELAPRAAVALTDYATRRVGESRMQALKELTSAQEYRGILAEVEASKAEYDEQVLMGMHGADAAKNHRKRLERIMGRLQDLEKDLEQNIGGMYDFKENANGDRDHFHDAMDQEKRYAPEVPKKITDEDIRAAMDQARAAFGESGFGKSENSILVDEETAAEHLKLLLRAGRLANMAAKQRMMETDTKAVENGRPPAVDENAEMPEGFSPAIMARRRDRQDTALTANLSLLEEMVGLSEAREGLLRDALRRGKSLHGKPDTFAPDSGKTFEALTPEEEAAVLETLGRFPAPWQPAVAQAMHQMALVVSQRGHYNGGEKRLAISRGDGYRDSERITMHEFMHAMEDVIDGIKEAETAFWKQRVGYVDTVKKDDGGFFPDNPLFPTMIEYSMKRYGDGAYELLTTGAENILGNGASQYLDDQFAAFIWGLLLTLRSR